MAKKPTYEELGQRVDRIEKMLLEQSSLESALRKSEELLNWTQAFWGCIETRRYTKEGSIIPVSISGFIYVGEDGEPVGSVINLRDISEQKELERQLQQAQKMEADGTLAGGIAHDFNNLLMGIQGCASLLYFDIDPCHPGFEYLNRIEDYIKNAANLTKQLLGFAR